MKTVRVASPHQHVDRGWPAVSALIDVDGDRYDICIRSSHGPLAVSADPFLALALLPAMKLGAELHIEGEVSPRLLQRMARLQSIICTWYKEYQRVTIRATGGSAPAEHQASGEGIGCFFSGGVDSSYSVLQRQDELTHLVLVHGFDITPGDSPLWQTVSAKIGAAAAHLSKPLITVETNARALLDVYTDWDLQSNGAALASVALALAPQFRSMYIAGAFPYTVLVPCGSHPLLDPLWSTEQLEIVHDAGDVNRWQKLAHLVEMEAPLQWLRVCWHNDNGAYNCGHCRKCLAVMAFLEAAGALPRCPTFTRPLDVAALAHMEVDLPGILHLRQTLLAAVEQFGSQPEIAQAIRASLALGPLHDSGGIYTSETPQLHVEKLEAQVRAAEMRAARLRSRLHSLESSRSWRLTAPLRRAGQIARRISKEMPRGASR